MKGGGGGKLTCDVAQGPNGLLTDVVVGVTTEA